jgi:hypothetical protein
MDLHPSHLADEFAALRIAAQGSAALARRSLGAVLQALLLAIVVHLLRRLERQIRAIPAAPLPAHHRTAVRPDQAVHAPHLPRWYRRNPHGALRRARRAAALIGWACRGLPGLGMRPARRPPAQRLPTPPARPPPPERPRIAFSARPPGPLTHALFIPLS